jgi:hypothetical protein
MMVAQAEAAKTEREFPSIPTIALSFTIKRLIKIKRRATFVECSKILAKW